MQAAYTSFGKSGESVTRGSVKADPLFLRRHNRFRHSRNLLDRTKIAGNIYVKEGT
jgi:hypothetical protein